MKPLIDWHHEYNNNNNNNNTNIYPIYKIITYLFNLARILTNSQDSD